jgi:CheY-like chemotaxis protein
MGCRRRGTRAPQPSTQTIDAGTEARERIRTLLEYGDALVTVVATARDALRNLQRVAPDVVVTDIAIPHENGY